MDAFYNIAKSIALQESVHLINDIPLFKAKNPQSFNDWLDQVAALNNNDPCKFALAKSQGSFNKSISSYPHTLGWNKIKEHVHYNFGSVAPKQHAMSMHIGQQQNHLKPYKNIAKDFWTSY